MREFQDSTAIVTGAAQGMGAEYARLLTTAGANVVLADIDHDAARRTASQLAGPGQALAVKADVSSPADCAAVVEAAIARFGRLDHLVNNAGLLSASHADPLTSIDEAEYRWFFDVMVHGMLWLTRAAVPEMERAGGGSVVNVSSIGSWMATGVYSLTKLAVNGLTVSLARELAPRGIRVNAVAPGTTDTEGMQPIMTREQMERWALAGGKPTARVAEPAEIARVGVFLLSDAAAYVRGQIVGVDDGQHVRV